MTRVYDERLAETGMTTTQFAILRNLSQQGGELPLTDLADRMVMERTSLYRTLAPIEQHGWVEIAPAPHGRAKIARLTAAGSAARDRATTAWAATQTAIVEAIGVEQWDALEAQLGRLIDISKRKTD